MIDSNYWFHSRICEVFLNKKFFINWMVARRAYMVRLETMFMKKRTIATLCGMLCAATFGHSATLELDKDRSRIQVDAKATGHNFTGTLSDYKASASGDAASTKPSAFTLSWNFTDLKTDDVKRDAEMVKWLGGGTPKGSFKFVKSWTDKAGNEQGMGNLTINGVSKTISFPYTAKKDGEWVTIDGKVSMDYQNFSLPIIRAMAVMTVEPQLVVRFHVVGKVK